MNYQNRIDIEEATMKEFRALVSATNIDAPAVGYVTAGRVTAKRDGDNKPIKGSMAKIVLTVVDSETAQMMISKGKSVKKLTGFTVEVEATENYLQGIDPVKLIGHEIDLSKAEVALLWVSRGENGSYNGFKLVIREVAFAQKQGKSEWDGWKSSSDKKIKMPFLDTW